MIIRKKRTLWSHVKQMDAGDWVIMAMEGAIFLAAVAVIGSMLWIPGSY